MVVHPVALRYTFAGDVASSVTPVIEEIESRLTWSPQAHLALDERIVKIGRALLALKEEEYLGAPREGPIGDRLAHLIDSILAPIEEEWVGSDAAGSDTIETVGRVKRIRAAVLPDMVNGEIDDAERDRRWRILADVYLAQQLSFYPPDYIADSLSPTRLVELIERYEEDLTDAARIHGPMHVTVTVGEAIEVSPKRDRGTDGDPLMQQIESSIRAMLGIA